MTDPDEEAARQHLERHFARIEARRARLRAEVDRVKEFRNWSAAYIARKARLSTDRVNQILGHLDDETILGLKLGDQFTRDMAIAVLRGIVESVERYQAEHMATPRNHRISMEALRLIEEIQSAQGRGRGPR